MMRRLPPSYVSNFDSASGFLRATSNYLNGQDFAGWGMTSALKSIVPLANLLPQRARETVYAVGGLNEAIGPTKTGSVDSNKIAEWATGLYPNRAFPGVMIGSSNGALTHLAAALGMPWLPQTIFIPVRQMDVHPDDAIPGMNAGLEPGRQLLEANPDLQLHHMHDPNQDRLMLKYMTYFRVKWISLPEAYKEFMRRNLSPGDPIIIINCERKWPVTRINDRHVFQFGALGGANEDDFFKGSDRVTEYLEKYQSHRRKWEPPEPTELAPEAEWGFEPSLRAEIEAFAAENDFRIITMSFVEPEDLSPLIADFYRDMYKARNLRANRLFAESFLMIEPFWTLRTGSVPFWMMFNMEGSRDALSAYLESTDPYDEIWLTLFQHGVECVGLPSIERWRELMAKARKRNGFLGVHEPLHPRDFGALASYQDDIQKLPSRYPLPGPVGLGELTKFIAENGGRYKVTWDGLTTHEQQ
jgi:hypothetical protein